MNRSPIPPFRTFVVGAVIAVCALGAVALVLGVVSATGRQERAHPKGLASTTTAALAADPVMLGGTPPTTQVDLESAAFDMCQGYVRTRLRASQTAKFPDLARGDGLVTVTLLKTAQYRVMSSVQATTKAGALFRNTFECVVTKDTTGWRLDDLKLT